MSKKTSDLVKTKESATLRLLFDENKIENYAEFSRKHGVPGGKSMVKQHLDGSRPISMEAAKAYIKGFGCELRKLSPRLADAAIESASMIPAANLEDSSKNNSKATTPNEQILVAGYRAADANDRELMLWLANRALTAKSTRQSVNALITAPPAGETFDLIKQKSDA